MEMSKKRFTIILISLIAAIGLVIGVIVLANMGLKAVDNEFLYTLPGDWEGTKDFSEGLAAVKTDGKWGFIDTEGNLVIEAIYDGAESFSEGKAAVQLDGRWGFINASGDTVISFTFQSVVSFSDGMAVYGEGAYYGYINEKGERVTGADFRYASSFKEGIGCVLKKDGSAYGFVNKDGAMVTDFIYAERSRPSEGRIAVFADDSEAGLLTGYLDLTGKEALAPSWYDAKPFSEGYAAVMETFPGAYGYIDAEGNTVIEAQWTVAEPFSQGYAAVQDSSGWRYIDTQGKDLSSSRYDLAYSFTSAGLARVAVKKDSGYAFGFVDKTGKEVVGLTFAEARDFYNGAAAVSDGRHWTFVSADGTVMSKYLWDDAGDFTEEGIARVRNGKYYGFVKLK